MRLCDNCNYHSYLALKLRSEISILVNRAAHPSKLGNSPPAFLQQLWSDFASHARDHSHRCGGFPPRTQIAPAKAPAHDAGA